MSKMKKFKNNVGKNIKALGFKRIVGLIFLLMVILVSLQIIYSITKAPKIKPSELADSLQANSKIVDRDGAVIGEVSGSEFRSYISIQELPEYVKDAFISIEDKRFRSHMGVDVIGIGSAMLDNVRHMSLVRGASTITQQLVKNVVLTNERTIDRKIQEAYLAFKLERELTKDQILEIYLNSIFFGQNNYGIEAASNAYFSKSASHLTVDEAATLAAIIQNPNQYSPYYKLLREDVNPKEHTLVGEVVVGGVRYSCVYSDKVVERRDLVLKELKKQGYINNDEYQTAINTNMLSRIKPSSGLMNDNTIHLIDMVKDEAVKIIANKDDIIEEKAENKLLTEGYTILTTVDKQVQNKLNNVINDETTAKSLMDSLDIRVDNYKNLVDSEGKTLYYFEDNLLKDGHIFFDRDEYEIKDGNINLKSTKIDYDNSNVYFKNYYEIKNNQLYIFNLGRTPYDKGEILTNEDGSITITKEFISDKPDFFTNDGKNLVINNKYYGIDTVGKKQPDVSGVIMDPQTGGILAVYGGRNPYNGTPSNKVNTLKMPPYKLLQPFTLYYPYIEDNGGKFNFRGNTLYPGDFRDADEIDFPHDIYNHIAADGIDKIEKSLHNFDITSENSTNSLVSVEEDPIENDFRRNSLAYGRLIEGMPLIDIVKANSNLNSNNDLKQTIVTKIIDSDGKVIYDKNDDKKVNALNKDVKFIVKNALSYNGKYYRLDNYIYKGRHNMSIIGSDNYVIGSLISNDNSNLRFKSKDHADRLVDIIEEAFFKEINSANYKDNTPEGVKAVCMYSEKEANETCLLTNNPKIEYLYTGDDIGICDIKHKVVGDEPVVDDEDIDEVEEDEVQDNDVEEKVDNNEDVVDEEDSNNSSKPNNKDSEDNKDKTNNSNGSNSNGGSNSTDKPNDSNNEEGSDDDVVDFEFDDEGSTQDDKPVEDSNNGNGNGDDQSGDSSNISYE